MSRVVVSIPIILCVWLLAACGGGSGASAPVSTAPTAPAPTATPTPGNSPPVITGIAPGGQENASYQFAPKVSDADGDDITLSASNLPSWLNLDISTGTITGTPDVRHIGQHSNIVITASDGEAETQLVVSINVEFNALEQALRTGNSAYIDSDTTLLDGVIHAIEKSRTKYDSVKNRLFALESSGTSNEQSLTNVSWDPSHDAALLKARFGSNEALLVSNAVTNPSYVVQSHALAIAGQTQTSRYAVFGSNPMRNDYRSQTALSQDMRSLVNNTLNWLSAKDASPNGPLNVVLAQLDQSYYFPDQVAVRSWLDQTYADNVTYNNPLSCNGQLLGDCLNDDTDILIVSSRLFDGESAPAIALQVHNAMQAGIAIMYLHHDGSNGELSKALLPLFDVDYHGDNYWRKLSIENFDAGSSVATLPVDVLTTRSLVERFKAQSFTADLSQCANTSCPQGHPYNDEFLIPVEAIQGQLRDFDKQGVRLFETSDYRYQKLLILLGDYYRQRVRFPMDRKFTPSILFLRSLYADHTVYHNRSINPAQPDMGNFSRSNFSHIAPASRSVTLQSTEGFRATGTYALPGVPFTISRQDQSDVTAEVFVNTLRSGATHQFDENGYSRPKYLKSIKYELFSGESLTLTSAHGGPIQIEFSARGFPVELAISQIGEHPFWASSADNSQFATALAAGNYDWAELVTPSFEVHSTLAKMRETMANPAWRTAAMVSSATAQYTHNYPHVLAGFLGSGIDVDYEIHDFATANGLDMDTLDKVKHMNADQATCGYGCSGNPYDAYWSFDPLGHGDLHELGHGLERSRFRFSGWDSHASTNFYSYYSKYRYYANTGDTGVLDGCESLPFEALFNTVQASANSEDPVAYMQDADLTDWSEGAAIYLQLMMRVQDDGALASGWNLLPRLHIIEREFSRADDTDTTWAAKRDGLGFAGMTRIDARRLSNNDWLLIALSHVTNRDLRNYLTMWGLVTTQFASDHVASMNLPALPVAFHVADSNAYCLGLNHSDVPVDGNQTWPSTSN